MEISGAFGQAGILSSNGYKIVTIFGGMWVSRPRK